MEPFIGEIRVFAGEYAPRGWALCNGAVLPITGNEPLFALIGTTYGGDGRTNFALPDLRGRSMVQNGQLAGGATYPLGAAGGTERVGLTSANLPAHNHNLRADTAPGTTNQPGALAFPQDPGTPGSTVLAYLPYNSADNTLRQVTLNNNTLLSSGGTQTHENRQPYVVINYIIALEGVVTV